MQQTQPTASDNCASPNEEFTRKYFSSPAIPNDPYQNFSSQSYAQEFQLNATGLMPHTWQYDIAPNSSQTCTDSSWAQYAPTRQEFFQYIQSSGPVLFQSQLRDSRNAKLGAPCLLRTAAPVPVRKYSKDSAPWFNDSSFRIAAVNNPPGCENSYTSCCQ